jgi:segregation and condensation protein B
MTGDDDGLSADWEPEVALAADVDGFLRLAETSFREETKVECREVSTDIEPVPETAPEGALSHGDSAPELSNEEIQATLEAVLYASGEPLTLRELKKVLSDVPPERVKQGIESLLETYSRQGKGLHIIQVAGGYQVTTRPEYHERVSAMFKAKPPTRLTIQALETLASIAYRQPVTVPEIMELRGVRSASVVRTLLERKLIRIVGRKNVVGRPLLYGTTKEFLVRFGLKDLKELPRLEDMADVFGEDLALPDDAVPVREAPAEGESEVSAENLDATPSLSTDEVSGPEDPNHEKDPVS